jgi:spermidine synthase
VAVIGIATGMTASGLLKSGLKSITCIELVPEVRDAAARFFSGDNRGVLSDPRVRTVIDDGRHFLGTTKARFDIILSDLFVPWHEGTGALYTLEHFKTVGTRLKPGGLFMLWLPAYEITEEEFFVIARTFCEAFPCVRSGRIPFQLADPLSASSVPMRRCLTAILRWPLPRDQLIQKRTSSSAIRQVCLSG